MHPKEDSNMRDRAYRDLFFADAELDDDEHHMRDDTDTCSRCGTEMSSSRAPLLRCEDCELDRSCSDDEHAMWEDYHGE